MPLSHGPNGAFLLICLGDARHRRSSPISFPAHRTKKLEHSAATARKHFVARFFYSDVLPDEAAQSLLEHRIASDLCSRRLEPVLTRNVGDIGVLAVGRRKPRTLDELTTVPAGYFRVRRRSKADECDARRAAYHHRSWRHENRSVKNLVGNTRPASASQTRDGIQPLG